MKSQGVIAKFQAVALVSTVNRQELSPRTQEAYLFWLRRFWRFVGRKPASEWTGADVEGFMARLVQEGYSDKSRRQSLCALVFVFKHVLEKDLGKLALPSHPKERKTVKIIPTREELARIFSGLHGQVRLMAGLMYGAGLRVKECCTLRVKDVDFSALTIRIHHGKGGKDRLCLLPMRLAEPLRRQIQWRAALQSRDLEAGAGWVDLPGRLASRYPRAARELAWQYLFPSTVLRDQRRWHAVPEAVQSAMRKAVRAAGILKPVTPHTLRHAFCTHALRSGNDPATVQELMGHDSLETTMLYAHGDHARGISPLDAGDLLPRRPQMSR
jgi:integron integrase